ncbi:MAG: ATP-binding cassette domain-containing protein [Desulfomonilaceae bacterium]|jgi:molybdate transport system ATP-binding protein
MEFAKNLVELENVSVRYGHSPILFNINFMLRPGENWAVLGGNGAGKTTFLRLIRGDIWPAPETGRRSYLVNGKSQFSPIGFREKTGIVSSDLLDQYRINRWNPSGIEAVCTGFDGTPFLYRTPTESMLARARQVLATLGLEKLATRRVLTMSFGEAKKVLIARAIVHRPRILFIDELCAGLDTGARKKVLEILELLAGQGTQMIVAAHDPSEIPDFVTRIITLESGRIVNSGSFLRPPCPTRNAFRADRAQRRSDVLFQTKLEQRHQYPLIRMENVDVSMGGKRILHQINWQIFAGRNWALLGANGSGKTTLLKLIAGELLPVWGGTIRRFEPDDPQSLDEIRKSISLVSPDFQADFPSSRKGLDIVLSGLYGSVGLACEPTGKQILLGKSLLQAFGVEGLESREVGALSYGQARILLIIRALINSPRILLLDEPLSGLDSEARSAVAQIIENAISAGATIINVTHDPKEILPSVSHVAVLKDGMITFQGAKGELGRHIF